MKTRKKRTQIEQERRNCLYNKTILHNKELAEKNTELSHVIDWWRTGYMILLEKYVNHINRKRWWQFWRWFE